MDNMVTNLANIYTCYVLDFVFLNYIVSYI